MRPCYAAPAAKSKQRPTQEVHAEEERLDAGVSSLGSRLAGNSQKRDAVSLTSAIAHAFRNLFPISLACLVFP